jgi:hypothetical protein
MPPDIFLPQPTESVLKPGWIEGGFHQAESKITEIQPGLELVLR